MYLNIIHIILTTMEIYLLYTYNGKDSVYKNYTS